MICDRFQLTALLITAAAVGQIFATTADTNKSEAERLVAAATQAEIEGASVLGRWRWLADGQGIGRWRGAVWAH